MGNGLIFVINLSVDLLHLTAKLFKDFGVAVLRLLELVRKEWVGGDMIGQFYSFAAWREQIFLLLLWLCYHRHHLNGLLRLNITGVVLRGWLLAEP